ncbi:hypothetical protein MJ584_00435 [Klebsiella pneumoniae]|nr:hypothetical protein MJ584_00435 [Klebsiella pneumoniae]
MRPLKARLVLTSVAWNAVVLAEVVAGGIAHDDQKRKFLFGFAIISTFLSPVCRSPVT